MIFPVTPATHCGQCGEPLDRHTEALPGVISLYDLCQACTDKMAKRILQPHKCTVCGDTVGATGVCWVCRRLKNSVDKEAAEMRKAYEGSDDRD